MYVYLHLCNMDADWYIGVWKGKYTREYILKKEDFKGGEGTFLKHVHACPRMHACPRTHACPHSQVHGLIPIKTCVSKSINFIRKRFYGKLTKIIKLLSIKIVNWETEFNKKQLF